MSEAPHLRRTLGPVMLWGLGVGYVISGEYFGWNVGLKEGGSYGMLAATVVITVMYLGFILSYAELACAIPRAGGAFVYADRAFGPLAGLLAGAAQLIEFVFAPPAIAMAIAAYVGQRYPGLPLEGVAIAAYLLFTAVNAWGVRQAVAFELVITILAVGELLLLVGVVGPSFSWTAFSQNALPHGWGGAFAAIPFAIWFYLAIEGVANAAEEARDPQRTVALGFGTAMLTLVALALLVFFSAVGVAGWEAVVFEPGTQTVSDAPLPLALAHVVARDSVLYTLLLGVGLLGLVASFHGIILAASRATMALAQAGYGPALLGRVNARTATPIAALIANMIAGVIAILSGKTSDIITLSCFGALTMYIIAMLALFRLRKSEPELPRPFKAILYPWGAGVALVIAVGSLIALTVSYPVIAGVFAVLMALAGASYKLRAAPAT